MTVDESDSISNWLNGLSILVVEDETIISFLIEDMLADLGCTDVWHAGGLNAALALVHKRKPDAAVLDVNLSGQPVYPLAEELAAIGVPFIFATGYGREGIPRDWTVRPVIQKPFNLAALATALSAVLPSRNDSRQS
jgi:CheY-like chemotaxis protein